VHGRDRRGDRTDEREGAPRGHVATIEERVDRDVADAFAPREVDERDQMPHVGVHAAGGQQSHEMQGVPSARRGAGGAEREVGEEGAVVDRTVDRGERLRVRVPGAHREMADLAVPHDAGRQPDGRAAGVERRVRAFAQDRVEPRRVRARRGVGG